MFTLTSARLREGWRHPDGNVLGRSSVEGRPGRGARGDPQQRRLRSGGSDARVLHLCGPPTDGGLPMRSDSSAGSSPMDAGDARRWRLFAAALTALSAIAVILVVGATLSTAAPIFTVVDTTDAPDAQLNGVCASTYMGLCTLRAAVQEAEHAGGAIIYLSPGIGDYRLTIPAGPEANDTLFCPAQPPAPPTVRPTAPAISTSAPTSTCTASAPPTRSSMGRTSTASSTYTPPARCG